MFFVATELDRLIYWQKIELAQLQYLKSCSLERPGFEEYGPTESQRAFFVSQSIMPLSFTLT